MIFSVDRDRRVPEPLEEQDLSGLDVLETRDLQEWVVETPEVLGEELLVITTEYGNFEGLRDRLDVLALDKNGKLVVVELKRDRADRTTDLQAIKYASYCATLTAEDVQKDYREFWNGREDRNLSPEDVGQEFRNFIEDAADEEVPLSGDGWAEFELDERPRILLAAGSFGTEVTAPVMWLLEEYGLDLTCTRIRAYEDRHGEILLDSQQIIPVEEAEDYMTRRREKQEKQKSASQREAAINVLLDRGVVEEGTELFFNPDKVPEGSGREYSRDGDYWTAVVTGKTGQSDNVEWNYDNEVYSFTGLTKEILNDLIGRKKEKALNGYKYWCHPRYDGRTLSDLRNSGITPDDFEEESEPLIQDGR